MTTRRGRNPLTLSSDLLTCQEKNDALAVILGGAIQSAVQSFLMARQAAGLSPKTVKSYRQDLGYFMAFCQAAGVVEMEDLTADHVRRYLLEMSTHRNPGGVHLAYRYVRALCNYWEAEAGVIAVTRKVRPPKYHPQPLPGVPLADVKAMIDAAHGRDKAILCTLLDTGVRAQELLDLNIGDLNLVDGSLQVRHGKGDKARVVYIGRGTRKALRQYLKTRTDLFGKAPLFVNIEGDRMKYEGLRMIICRRSKDADVPEPALHDFRRCCAVTLLRNGVDLLTVARLLGHSDLSVIRRYVYLLDADLAQSHALHGPVDNL